MERAQLSIGQRLKQERASRGWIQEYVAEHVGVDPATVRRWENDLHVPQLIHRQLLCNLFGKTAQELGLADETAPSASLPVVQTVPSPVELHDEDALSIFLKTNLPIRLLGLVGKSRSYAETYREFLSILKEGAMNIPRRKVLEAIAILAAYPISELKLNSHVANVLRSAEEILAYCTPGVIACWELSRGKELTLALSAVTSYIPPLEYIVRQASSEQQRKDAAHLLVQCLLLKTRLVRDLHNSQAALVYAQQAKQYSEFAGDPVLHVLAVRTLANVQLSAHQWKQAVVTAKEAENLLTLHRDDGVISPLIRSFVHSGLVVCQARAGQKDSALASSKIAYRSYHAQPRDEPPPIWIGHSLANVYVSDGLAYMHLGLYKEALDVFEQVFSDPERSMNISVNTLNYQVLAEAHRQDEPPDMERCIDLWKQGLQGAITLQSEPYFNESLKGQAILEALWPGEQGVEELRELIVHW